MPTYVKNGIFRIKKKNLHTGSPEIATQLHLRQYRHHLYRSEKRNTVAKQIFTFIRIPKQTTIVKKRTKKRQPSFPREQQPSFFAMQLSSFGPSLEQPFLSLPANPQRTRIFQGLKRFFSNLQRKTEVRTKRVYHSH